MNKKWRPVQAVALGALFLFVALGRDIRPAISQLPNKPKPLYQAVVLPMERAADLNNRGDVAGVDENGGLVLWHDGKRRVLSKSPFFLTKAETPYEGEIAILPTALTDDGRIAGTVEYFWSGAITTGQSFPFVWEKNRLRRARLPVGRRFNRHGAWLGSEDIGALTFDAEHGDTALHPSEMTENGKRYRHAVLYHTGNNRSVGRTDLGVLPGSQWSVPQAMNDSEQVVGTSEQLPFVWRNGAMRALPLNSLARQGRALDISNSGIVVGDASVGTISNSTQKAVVWRNGTMLDLNRVTRSLPTKFHLTSAVAVNDRGQILANAEGSEGETKAFVLTPIKP